VPDGDVWGIGGQIDETLTGWGVRTALDLARLNVHTMRERYGITGARIIEELRGVRCLSLEESPPPKQTITVSRSFGDQATTLDELRAATRMVHRHYGHLLSYDNAINAPGFPGPAMKG
jgi:DNA polymerase V